MSSGTQMGGMAAPESLNARHDRRSWQHASYGAACSAGPRGVSSSLNQGPCVGLGLPTSRFYRQLCRRRSSTEWLRNPREQDLIATAAAAIEVRGPDRKVEAPVDG